jgi:outer membrane protein TolC
LNETAIRVGKAAGQARRLAGWAAPLLLGACLRLPSWAEGATGPVPGRSAELTLVDFVSLVLEHNETLQAQLLEAEVSHRKARAEGALFEPDLSLSAERDWNKRLNNSIQQSAAGGLLLFQERNNIYDSGLETLIPTGGKIRLGYTLSDLMNNLTNPISLGNIVNGGLTREYQSFAGVTFTQPLLKNGGVSATMANARLAALDSDIAFQQYRRQLMVSVSQAEAAYWNLYFAQEQLRFFEESVGVAEGVLADSQERLKAGQGAELEVMEAQSGLALRRTKHNDARQNYFEALGRALGLYGALPDATGGHHRRAVLFGALSPGPGPQPRVPHPAQEGGPGTFEAGRGAQPGVAGAGFQGRLRLQRPGEVPGRFLEHARE